MRVDLDIALGQDALMASNGDERQAAAWERVEAKLDRVGERLTAVEHGIAGLGDALLRLGARIDLLNEKLDLTRQVLEQQIAKLRVELLNEADSMAKFEAAGRSDRLQAQLDDIVRRIEALETAAATTMGD